MEFESSPYLISFIASSAVHHAYHSYTKQALRKQPAGSTISGKTFNEWFYSQHSQHGLYVLCDVKDSENATNTVIFDTQIHEETLYGRYGRYFNNETQKRTVLKVPDESIIKFQNSDDSIIFVIDKVVVE